MDLIHQTSLLRFLRHRRCLQVLSWLLLVTAALSGNSQSLAAQVTDPSSEGWIQILEPRELMPEGARGLRVRARSSIKVVGLAYHPSGIAGVRMNGVNASHIRTPSGEYRFTAFLNVTESMDAVDIIAQIEGGGRIIRTFSVEALPSTQAYATPDDAFSDDGPTFRGERWAVVIGVSDFQDPNIPDLRYADDDAQAFFDFLISERAGLGGFKEENIRLLLNEEATERTIKSALRIFLQRATEDDIVIVYFSGHGAPDPRQPDELYLLPYDAEADAMAATAIRMRDFHEDLRSLDYSHLVLFTDACHAAGVSTRAELRDLSTNQINRLFLEGLEGTTGGLLSFTASRMNQTSEEGARWGGGHGVFTHFLLRGLEGDADTDADHVVTLEELTDYVEERVRRGTDNRQIPDVSSTSFDGYLPLALVPADDVPDEPGRTQAPTPIPAVQDPDAVVTRPGEDDPGPARDPEAEAATAGLDLTPFNPSQEAVKSFFVPGMGQLATGRKGPGIGFLAGFAGALGTGLLITKVDIECLTQTPQACSPEDVYSETTTRPYLGMGVGAAIAISAIAAWDAYRGAKAHNERVRAATGGNSSYTLEGPRLYSSPGRGVAMEWLRVRF